MFKEQQKDPIKQKTPQLELLKEEPTSSLFSRVFLDCGISPNYVFGFGHKLPRVEGRSSIAIRASPQVSQLPTSKMTIKLYEILLALGFNQMQFGFYPMQWFWRIFDTIVRGAADKISSEYNRRRKSGKRHCLKKGTWRNAAWFAFDSIEKLESWRKLKLNYISKLKLASTVQPVVVERFELIIKMPAA